ncbi:Serine-pyruvate aminotransferase/archaeal aspartate aminotransferase [Thermoplasmatales archaeon BRNA1]|nr:Serine-pyruvate aminotransferase/archaeal aspartate aminotransferase [Thermoplasmatales archaeon BRNA1]
MSRKLYTVGPINVSADTLQAMDRPMMTHRTKEYKALHHGIMEKMHKALGTDDDIFLVAGSATVLLEGAARNGIRKHSLGLTGGSFGDRSIEVAKLNGRQVDVLKKPMGIGFTPADLEGKVTSDIDAVHWVSNESSSGVQLDNVALAKEVRDQNPDAIVMIDAVTSMFALDHRMKELQADSVVFGSQKDLALPPGIAFVVVSKEMMKRSEKMENKGFYADFVKLKEKNDEDYALTTPPVSLMYGLDYQLDKMLKEGMATRYRRHEEMAEMVRKWADEKMEGIFPEKGFESKTIGVVKRGDLDFDRFHSIIKSKGMEISNGYGDAKKSTFRIGTMGDLTKDDIKQLLTTMDEALEEMKQ